MGDPTTGVVLERLFAWIKMGNPRDHACLECVKTAGFSSDSVIDGNRCGYHAADDHLTSTPSEDPVAAERLTTAKEVEEAYRLNDPDSFIARLASDVWMLEGAGSSECGLCGGAGWYSTAHPKTGEQVQTQCEDCFVAVPDTRGAPRYRVGLPGVEGGMERWPDGRWILTADHDAVVAELQREAIRLGEIVKRGAAPIIAGDEFLLERIRAAQEEHDSLRARVSELEEEAERRSEWNREQSVVIARLRREADNA